MQLKMKYGMCITGRTLSKSSLTQRPSENSIEREDKLKQNFQTISIVS